MPDRRCVARLTILLHADSHSLTPHPCRFIAAATIPGALRLLRFGMTLAAQPASSAWRIADCTLLALSHLWLLQAHPDLLPQVSNVSYKS